MSDTVIVALISLIGTIITVLTSNASQRKKTKEDIQEQVGQLKKQVSDIDAKFDDHIRAEDETTQKDRRTRVLRFSSELQDGKNWSKECFDDVLEDIDSYESYCDNHPEYHNGKGRLAIQYIHSEYDKRFLHK